MRKIILLILIIGLKVNLTAQVPTIQWEKSFGGSMNDRGYSICNGSNGDFIIAGTTESSDGDISINKGFSDLWLIRIDSTGNLIWEKALGGSWDEEACTVLNTLDNGFIILGTTNSQDGDITSWHIDSIFPVRNTDGWLVKTDSSGIIQWQKCIGGTDDDYGRDLTICIDSSYLIAERIESSDGDITNFHGGFDDYWLAKIDLSGNIEWSSAYGGNSGDYPTCCTQTTDGNYIISGCSDFDFGGYHGTPGFGGEIGLVKVDSSGNKIWSKCYSGTDGACAYSIIPADNAGFYLVSENSSNDGDVSIFYGSTDLWVFKADSLGNILWERSYGGSYYEMPRKIIKTSDEGLLIACTTLSHDYWVSNNHGQLDCWLVKLDSMGNLEWDKSLGGTLDDYAYSIVEAPDGGFVFCGYTTSTDGDITFNHGNQDVWVVKLSPPSLGIPTLENQFTDFTTFQNGDQLILRFFSKDSGTSQITLSNTLGENILEKEITFREGINYASINLPALAEGMYFINAEGNGIGKGKVFIK